jgi:uncharacterized protein (TIRG00374 family)
MSAPPKAAPHPAAAKPSWFRRAARHPWIFQAVILAVLIALAVWQIDFGQVAQSFKQADYAWLTVALLLYSSGRVVHAVEWRLCLTKVGFLPFPGLFGAFLIGNFVNAVAPARAGDLARIQILSNRYGVSRAGLIAGQGAESAVDTVILIVLGLASLALLDLHIASPTLLWVLSGLVIAAFIAVTIASRFLPERLPHLRPLERLSQRAHDALREIWPHLRNGLESLRNTRLLAVTVALNSFGWFLDLLVLWAFGLTFGLDVPPSAYLSITVATSLLTAFPVTPGSVGTYELVIVQVLRAYGVSADDSLAYAVATHLLTVVTMVALGLLAMPFMRVTLHEVVAFRRAATKDPPPQSPTPIPTPLP